MILVVARFIATVWFAVVAAGPREPQRVMVEANLLRNALDASGHYGCRISAEPEAKRRTAWWFTFGEVRPHSESGWEAIGASSRCGDGTFDSTAASFTRLIGAPYLILDVTVAPLGTRKVGVTRLETSVEMRRLSGFEEDGTPVYGRRSQARTLELEDAWILPVLLADGRETEAFRVQEVLVRLRAERFRPDAAYGTLSVTADMPGAEILLDDGLVGRTSEGGPTIVRNVLVGQRQVRVRDFSGREVLKPITVAQGQAVTVAFDLLPQSSAKVPNALVPLGSNPQGRREYWRVKDGTIVVLIPAGEFPMGSPEGVGQPHERPQRRVHVSEFLMDKTEVTWRQFRTFSEHTGTESPPVRSWGTPDDYPVSSVDWETASEYCEWVGGRLPTEAEWEKAARGPQGLDYPWGNDWDPDRCNSWIGGTNSPHAVGSFPGCVSPYGLLDMAGNMWEWCSDAYEDDYYAESPLQDPPGPHSGKFRVLRGGDWISQPLFLRTAHRHRMVSTNRYQSCGFRCVQERQD